MVENWNGANDFIFYANGGVIQSNQLADQEASVGKMTERDMEALSPMIHAHITPYGSFDLDLAERLPLAA